MAACSGSEPVFRIFHDQDPGVEVLDGEISKDGRVWGTYVHGLFDADRDSAACF
ncbi:MAG: hypothetical protein GX133_09380 [Syntrophomonadaceae bacterium]|nr:hypothetical protein [Syntrophomonadaceae bacterium]